MTGAESLLWLATGVVIVLLFPWLTIVTHPWLPLVLLGAFIFAASLRILNHFDETL